MMHAVTHIPWPIMLALCLVVLPFAIIFGAIGLKLLWGFWPAPAAFIAAGWTIWHLGFEWIWLIALAIIAAIALSWLWQRSRMFLAGDRWLERVMMLGD